MNARVALSRIYEKDGSVVVQLARAFIYGNFHIALVAFALIQSTGIFLGTPVAPSLVLLISFGAQFVYSIEHLWGASEDLVNHPQRTQWLGKRRAYSEAIQILSLTIVVGCLWFVSPLVVICSFSVALICVAYYRPIRQLPQLRQLPFAKPLVVAFVWTVAVIVPVALSAGAISLGLLFLLLGYRFATLLANLVIADYHDREGDRRAGMQTMATRFSPRTNFLTVIVLSLSAAIMAFFLVVNGLSFILLAESAIWIGLPTLFRRSNRILWCDLLLICPYALMLTFL